MPRAYDVPVLFAGAATEEKLDFLVNTSDRGDDEGILIPQDLLASGWVMVIDFGHDELRFEPEEDALRRIPGLQEVDYKTCSFDNHRVTPVRPRIVGRRRLGPLRPGVGRAPPLGVLPQLS